MGAFCTLDIFRQFDPPQFPLRRQFYHRDAVAAVAGRGGGVGADEGVLGEHLADGAAEGAGALAVDDAQLGEAGLEALDLTPGAGLWVSWQPGAAHLLPGETA